MARGMKRFLSLLLLVAGIGAAPHASARTAPLPETVAIDVLIEPDATMVEAAQAMNARLRAEYPAGYALDASHRPHITLLQRYVRAADLDKVSAAVAKVLAAHPPEALRLRATGYVAADFASNGLMLLGVDNPPALAALQQAVVDAVQPYAVGGGTAAAFVPDPAGPIVQGTIDWVETFVPKASGPKFWPHVTVGVAPLPFLKGVAAEPFPGFAFGASGVAIYQLGNYGTAQKLLWRNR